MDSASFAFPLADAKPANRVRVARIAAAKTNPDTAADAVLVGRFNAGDEAAFVEILSRHRRKIYSLVFDCVHNHADAEEVTEDTFVRAHRGLARFRGEAALGTWLHHIAVNLSRNRYWYLYRRRNISQSLDAPLVADSDATLQELVASEAADPSQEMIEGEFSSAVAACIEKLPAPQRDILKLRGVLGRPYAEISQALEIEVGTVKSRVARAREALRAQIGALFPEISLEGATTGHPVPRWEP